MSDVGGVPIDQRVDDQLNSWRNALISLNRRQRVTSVLGGQVAPLAAGVGDVQ